MENKKICWVTGFNHPYYNSIGVSTLDKWNMLPGDKIFLCEMDPTLVNTSNKKVDIRKDISEYYPEMQIDIEKISKKAYKFFRKAFCIWHALKNFSSDYDYIIWLDTDAVITSNVNMENLLPNDDQLFSTIIRGEHGCDSGYVAFNTKHKNFNLFPDVYINYYTSGKIWKMHNPWDAYILEDISKTENIKNLYIGTHTTTLCGFEDTLLSPFMHHFWGKKGKIKLRNKHEI